LLYAPDINTLAYLLTYCVFDKSNTNIANDIKTKSRNRLETNRLDMLVRMSSLQRDGQNIDIDKVYQERSSQQHGRQGLQ